MNDIYISGQIDSEMSQWFTESLNSKEGDVTVYINSGGGSVFAGKEIANAIKRRKGTRTVCNGLAASSASYILFASEHPVVYSDSVIMLHKPSSTAEGNAADLKKTIEALDAIQTSMEADYLRFWKGTPESLKRAIDRETWLAGSEITDHFNVEMLSSPVTFACNSDDASIYSMGMAKWSNSVSLEDEEAEEQVSPEPETPEETVESLNETPINTSEEAPEKWILNKQEILY